MKMSNVRRYFSIPAAPKKTRVREQSSRTRVLLEASSVPSSPGEGGMVRGNSHSLTVCWGLSGAFYPRRLWVSQGTPALARHPLVLANTDNEQRPLTG
jgi:hypothetical protein